MKSVADVSRRELKGFLQRFGLGLSWVAADEPIPGSYWGVPEAGLIGRTLFVQPATPLHSLLHEAAHVLMTLPAKRAMLDTDAGGSDPEEEAVCRLQVTLAESLPGYSRAACLADMDAWGYSFRQGSAAAWLAEDGPEAQRRWPPHVQALMGRGACAASR